MIRDDKGLKNKKNLITIQRHAEHSLCIILWVTVVNRRLIFIKGMLTLMWFKDQLCGLCVIYVIEALLNSF